MPAQPEDGCHFLTRTVKAFIFLLYAFSLQEQREAGSFIPITNVIILQATVVSCLSQ